MEFPTAIAKSRCKPSLANTSSVSLTIIEAGRPHSMIFTGELAGQLDERQYEVGFGPCMDAAITGRIIVVDDDNDGSPYGEFAAWLLALVSGTPWQSGCPSPSVSSAP